MGITTPFNPKKEWRPGQPAEEELLEIPEHDELHPKKKSPSPVIPRKDLPQPRTGEGKPERLSDTGEKTTRAR